MKAKRKSTAEALARPCPTCRAAAGATCKNYAGKGQAPHRERYTERQLDAQAAGRARTRAEQLNDREREAMPLFAAAGIAADWTAEDTYNIWRRNVAEAAERCAYISACQVLMQFRCIAVRRFALAAVGAEAFAELDAMCRARYPSSDYWYGFWKSVLTGEPVVFGYRKVEDRQPGQPATVPDKVYQQAHLTAAEFYARFPYADPPPPEAPDDGGLVAHLDAVLAKIRERRLTAAAAAC